MKIKLQLLLEKFSDKEKKTTKSGLFENETIDIIGHYLCRNAHPLQRKHFDLKHALLTTPQKSTQVSRLDHKA